MKNNILILFFLALCSMASAQINYDEEQEDESFSLNTPLNSNRSYHYTALSRIDLNPGFSYAPARGKSALFEIDPMMVVPPTGSAYAKCSTPAVLPRQSDISHPFMKWLRMAEQPKKSII